MSNTTTTLVEQNLGAGHADRAEQAVWRAAFYNVVVLGVVGLAFVVLAGPIVGIFTSDAAVQLWGERCLRTVAAGFLFYAYGMVVTQSFNGAGDTRTPTLINLVVFWALQLPLAWLLSHRTDLGPSGVYIALAASFSVFAAIGVVLFRRGRWKLTRV